MNERIFTDLKGEQLIVKHRKSAVFFLRETDLSIEGYVSSYWTDKTPVFNPEEIKRTYSFSPDVFVEVANYLNSIAQESWKNFTPKVADSFGADYDQYYDREHENEGSLSVSKNSICVEGPYQYKKRRPLIRLYKFNKRKFESFIYDLNILTKEVTSNGH